MAYAMASRFSLCVAVMLSFVTSTLSGETLSKVSFECLPIVFGFEWVLLGIVGFVHKEEATRAIAWAKKSIFEQYEFFKRELKNCKPITNPRNFVNAVIAVIGFLLVLVIGFVLLEVAGIPYMLFKHFNAEQ